MAKLPEGVVDKKAYAKMIKLQKHPIFNKGLPYVCSDGTEINIGWFPGMIKKKMSHLPAAEIQEMLDKKSEYYQINNQLTVYKRNAYGLVQGRPLKGENRTSMIERRKEELIDLFGRMFTVDEVYKIVQKDWGMPLGKRQVMDFRTNHATEIEKRIERHQATYSDIRLGVKRSRMEELSHLYNKQKDKHEETNARDDLKILLSILEQVRKEAEGNRLTIDGKVDINYEANIHVHLQQEVFKTFNLKEIILGRVAAKMGINPVKLIYSLQNSYYKRFSNVLGDYDPDADGEMIYPSQMNYDFERIGRMHQQHDQDVEDAIILEEENNDKDAEKAELLKAKLLEKLKRKKATVKDAESGIKAQEAVKKSKTKKKRKKTK